jgi:hypothetical protein
LREMEESWRRFLWDQAEFLCGNLTTHFFNYPSTRDKTIKWVHCEEVGGQSAGQYQKFLWVLLLLRGGRLHVFLVQM